MKKKIKAKAIRRDLPDGSFVEIFVQRVPPDQWRPHGVHYRLVWVQTDQTGVKRARVLFDTHHGKSDHVHLDGQELPYQFRGIDQLLDDFEDAIRKRGGAI